MWSYLVAMAGLGVLGFDPGPGLIALAALALGARRRDIVLFGVLLIGGTAAWGIALTAVAGAAIEHIHLLAAASSPVGLLVETIVAVVIGVWSIIILLRRSRAPAVGASSTTSAAGGSVTDPDQSDARAAAKVASGIGPLCLVACAFVAVVIMDPPFPAGVVASAGRPEAVVVLGFLLWAVISQFPLAVVAGAAALGRTGKVSALGNRWGPPIVRFMRAIGPVLGLLAAVALLVWVGVHLGAGA